MNEITGEKQSTPLSKHVSFGGLTIRYQYKRKNGMETVEDRDSNKKKKGETIKDKLEILEEHLGDVPPSMKDYTPLVSDIRNVLEGEFECPSCKTHSTLSIDTDRPTLEKVQAYPKVRYLILFVKNQGNECLYRGTFAIADREDEKHWIHLHQEFEKVLAELNDSEKNYDELHIDSGICTTGSLVMWKTEDTPVKFPRLIQGRFARFIDCDDCINGLHLGIRKGKLDLNCHHSFPIKT